MCSVGGAAEYTVYFYNVGGVVCGRVLGWLDCRVYQSSTPSTCANSATLVSPAQSWIPLPSSSRLPTRAGHDVSAERCIVSPSWERDVLLQRPEGCRETSQLVPGDGRPLAWIWTLNSGHSLDFRCGERGVPHRGPVLSRSVAPSIGLGGSEETPQLRSFLAVDPRGSFSAPSRCLPTVDPSLAGCSDHNVMQGRFPPPPAEFLRRGNRGNADSYTRNMALRRVIVSRPRVPLWMEPSSTAVPHTGASTLTSGAVR